MNKKKFMCWITQLSAVSFISIIFNSQTTEICQQNKCLPNGDAVVKPVTSIFCFILQIIEDKSKIT